jgi:FixJ family two-component response regulator
VDDDQSIREAVGSLVSSLGLRGETFASAEEFLCCGHFGEIGCLILDIHMPGINGFELQRQLSEGMHSIPTVVITAHGTADIRQQAFNNGAVDFLLKPFSEQALLNAVYAALKLKNCGG